jgi:hypothetical protein
MGNGKVGATSKKCLLKVGSILATIKRTDTGTKGKVAKPLKNVTFSVTGSADKRSGGSGAAEFTKLDPGTYTVQAALTKTQLQEFDLDEATKTATVVAQQQATVEFQAVRVLVTPKLEVEYKVVPLDRGGSKHQESTETKVTPDPIYVLVSLSQEPDKPLFAGGGKLTATPANVEVFEEEACTTKVDLTKVIPNDKVGGKELKLWLRGKTKGKFELKFEAATPLVKPFGAGPAVTVPMAVVDLEMKVHKQDVTKLEAISVDPTKDPSAKYYTKLNDKQLPPQKALTDEEKVKQGRVLHAQKAGAFGRARLLFPKSAPQWPKGCDGYKLVIDEKNTSGAVEIYDKEFEGTKKAFPVEISIADLLKGKEIELWVEGKTTTAKECEVQLEVGLDRGVEGGQPAATKRRRADFARFTVVEIKEIVLDHTPPIGKADAWTDAKTEFCVNLEAGDAGRKIKLKATLEKPIKDVPVHFMLAPDVNNQKAANWGVDLPPTWTWHKVDWSIREKDRKKPEDLLHVSAKTDALGVATAEVLLSQIGGDVFQPAAYIVEDAHLAKYVAGHVELGKKKPDLAAKKIKVRRKIWFQRVIVEGINCPEFDGAIAQYDRVKVDMIKAADLSVPRATVNGYNPQAIYPKYMIEVNGGNGDALVVSDANKPQFFTTFAAAADKPNMIPVLVCDAQWDPHPDGDTNAVSPPAVKASSFPVSLNVGKKILTPPLQGGDLVVTGTWMAAEWDAAANAGAGEWTNVRNDDLSDADVTVDSTRDSLMKVSIALPAGVGPTTAQTSVWIENLSLQAAKSYLGELSEKRILAVYKPTEPADFQNTIAHEIGHAYHQVIEGSPAGAVKGVPKHPNQKDMGQGNHCRNLVNQCVMYDSGPIATSLNRYCDMCHPYLLLQDMTSIV